MAQDSDSGVSSIDQELLKFGSFVPSKSPPSKQTANESKLYISFSKVEQASYWNMINATSFKWTGSRKSACISNRELDILESIAGIVYIALTEVK